MAAPNDPRSLARRNKPVSGDVEDYEREDELDEGPLPEDIERFGASVTTTCRSCGTELLDDVLQCWKCGADVGPGAGPNNGLPLWAVFTAVIVVMLFAVAVLRFLF